VAEFEITNDNVSGVELKAFLGASLSGFVVIDGADAAARNQFQSLAVYPSVTPLSDATGDANERRPDSGYFRPAEVRADGSFTIKGLQAGSVGFYLSSYPSSLRIKRIERDGVEVKDAIEVKPGEKIAGVRIVAYQPQGRIRGQVQIAEGALPEGSHFQINAARPSPPDESKSSPRAPVSVEGTGGYAFADEKGRFVIEGLPAGEYDLSITFFKRNADGSRNGITLPGSNQRVTVRENAETSVTITFDSSRINQPQNQPNNQEDLR